MLKEFNMEQLRQISCYILRSTAEDVIALLWIVFKTVEFSDANMVTRDLAQRVLGNGRRPFNVSRNTSFNTVKIFFKHFTNDSKQH